MLIMVLPVTFGNFADANAKKQYGSTTGAKLSVRRRPGDSIL
jgi:hypothetical protein